MASALRKLADKLEGKDNTEHNNPQSSNFGPHSSAATNKVDPRVDSDFDGRNDPTSRVGGYGNTQASHAAPGVVGGGAHHQSTSTGPHDSNLANKLDPRVDSTQSSNVGGGYGTTHTTTTHTTNTGAHNSNLANQLDPRVDSDRTTHASGYGNTHSNTQSANVGPHSSNLMNKLDPRVDSDLDGRNNPTSHVGGHGHTQTSTHGPATATGAGYGNIQSSTAGPHSSNVLNKLDPRVDSDLDGRNNPTSHVGGHGHTQTSTYGTTTGTHTVGGNQGYTGTNTASNDPRSTNTGPHSSNLLNKLDPRVDSDRDGRNDPTSRTGGYGQTQTGTGGVGRY